MFQTENQQRIQAIQSYLENGLLNIDQVTQAHFNFLHSRKKQEERKKSLSSGDQLVAMVQRQEDLPTATELALKQPQNQEAFAAYLRLAQRQSSEEAINEFISKYLNYYLAVRNSNNPFDLKDLHHAISPKDLRLYIAANIKSKNLKYLQLEFLFAEMIRRLKLGNGYTGGLHTWPTDEIDPLHKTKIFHHIFSELLAQHQGIPAFTSAKKELNINKPMAKARLAIFIGFHLRKCIEQFDPSKSNFFNIIAYEFETQFFEGIPFQLTQFRDAPHACNFDKSDLRYVDLSEFIFEYQFLSFDKADVRHSNFKNASINDTFDFEPLFTFSSTDFRKANLTGFCKYNKFCYFMGADLRESILDDPNDPEDGEDFDWNVSSFDSTETTFDLTETTPQKTIISKSQAETIFSDFAQGYIKLENLFTIVDDNTKIVHSKTLPQITYTTVVEIAL